MKYLKIVLIGLVCLVPANATVHAQDAADIGEAVVYGYNPSTQLGDPVFGTLVADMQHDHPGRCSHGGPVGLQYRNIGEV